MKLFHLFSHQSRKPATKRQRRGLTMFETALATVVVGTAITAIVKLITAVSQENFYAQKTTTALTLADDLRELVDGLPMCDPANGVHLGPDNGVTQVSQFDDVEDFANYTANPPIDAHCQPITALANWKQTVTVTHILPGNYTATDPSGNDQGCTMDRVLVTITYNPPGTIDWITVASVEWLKARI